MTTYQLLTPPGTGAIAVTAVRGPQAWPTCVKHFTPNAGTLPLTITTPRRWFGTFAGDEVILFARSTEDCEIHSHGGVAVTRLIHRTLDAAGIASAAPVAPDAWQLLRHAPTLRTAGILLDQCHGAMERAITAIEDVTDSTLKNQLIDDVLRFAEVGRHLVEPWLVAIVGAPNAGKSSLMNALAGYERSVVSPVAGTTRDAVRMTLAFDGWPITLVDTAGLRTSTDAIEREGVARALTTLDEADLVVEVIDGTAPSTVPVKASNVIRVANKCDHAAFQPSEGALSISAISGAGLPELIAAMVERLVPHAPPPGAAVPESEAVIAKLQSMLNREIEFNPRIPPPVGTAASRLRPREPRR